MRRRTFLQQGIGAAAGFAFLGAFPRDKRCISVQLWSVRDDMFRDPAGTTAKLAEFGYHLVEGAGYDKEQFYKIAPKEYGKILKDNGIKMKTAHCRFLPEDMIINGKAISDRYKKALDLHAEIGCKFVMQNWLPPEERNLEYTKKMCDGLNMAGEYAKKVGMQYAYHNHDFEFIPFPTGEKMYDVLLERCDPALVKMQLDLYWVAYANEDPLVWFDKAPGRYKLFHVKDMAKTPKRETIEIGAGVIDFQSIFKSQEKAGTEYFVVELEHYKTTPMQGVHEALDALKALKFK